MRRAFEKEFGKIEDRFDPGRFFLGTKLEQIQNNDPQVEEMTLIGCRQPGDEELFSCEIEKDGRFRVKKGAMSTNDPPETNEQLRDKYRILSNCWLYAKLRHPGRDWLRDLDATTYTALADYILGPKVATLNLGDEDDDSPARYPPKKVVMGYEKAIRRFAYTLVRDGDAEGKRYTLAEAIKKACTDPETRQFNFVVKTTSYVTTPFTDFQYQDAVLGLPPSPWSLALFWSLLFVFSPCRFLVWRTQDRKGRRNKW